MPTEPSPIVLLVAVVSVIVAGAAIAVQAPINAVLNRTLADPILTACISFFVGFVALALIWVVSLTFREQAFALPSLSAVPIWAWIGGFLGTTYVLAALWSVPRVGVVTVVASVVLGQLLAATVMDAIGAFGLEAKPISWTRVASVLMVMGGLVLSRL
ncbi:MAG: DMT family transporter [Pseudomonadota bacterium]